MLELADSADATFTVNEGTAGAGGPSPRKDMCRKDDRLSTLAEDSTAGASDDFSLMSNVSDVVSGEDPLMAVKRADRRCGGIYDVNAALDGDCDGDEATL